MLLALFLPLPVRALRVGLIQALDSGFLVPRQRDADRVRRLLAGYSQEYSARLERFTDLMQEHIGRHQALACHRVAGDLGLGMPPGSGV